MSFRSLTSSQARSTLIEDLNRQARDQLKLLLETKHLYQKVTIDVEKIIGEISQLVNEAVVRKQFQHDLMQIPSLRFTPTDRPLKFEKEWGSSVSTLQLLLSNVKVFCDECKSREVFSPIWFLDVASALTQPNCHAFLDQRLPDTFQIFFLAYQCQRCKGVPIAFQVRRDRWSLILEGRSPIEHIELPSFIPDQESWLIRDALIAKNTGKFLAALFYLRTSLIRFARRQTGVGEEKTDEEIMTVYGEGLPSRIRDEMPSLREWYDKLSKALHEAREDGDLFEEARAEIERHFDMRRLHRIPDNSQSSPL